MLVDDVFNQSFRDFVQETGKPDSMVCRSADGTWMFGLVRKADGGSGRERGVTPSPGPVGGRIGR